MSYCSEYCQVNLHRTVLGPAKSSCRFLHLAGDRRPPPENEETRQVQKQGLAGRSWRGRQEKDRGAGKGEVFAHPALASSDQNLTPAPSPPYNQTSPPFSSPPPPPPLSLSLSLRFPTKVLTFPPPLSPRFFIPTSTVPKTFTVCHPFF